jgi:hypothetical protein
MRARAAVLQHRAQAFRRAGILGALFEIIVLGF